MIFSITIGIRVSAYADDIPNSGSCGENVTYTFDSKTGLLTISGTGDMTDYEYVNHCPLSYRSEIKNVVIEEGVTGIGALNLCFCDNIESITIPSTVTKIGKDSKGALYANHGLNIINVNKYNTVYDSRNNCNAIIKTADNELIVGCSSTVIPETVTKIGDSAFLECINLTTINIPKSVTAIGSHAFAGCKSLKGIIVPANVTTLETGALSFGSLFGESNSAVFFSVDKDNKFYDSRNDCNAVIETATNTLLYGCNATVIPFTVETIANSAFGACTNLKNLNIPYSVKSIEGFAFDWAAMDSITIYNPECEIHDSQYTLFETKKIYGYENSTAQQYANKYSIPFEAITCEHSDTAVYKENEKAATYYVKGSYDNVTRCSTCGKEVSRETVKTDTLKPTLTIHWSSIDGVDLMEPVVVENVNPDATVKDALESAGIQYSDDIFIKYGYSNLGMILPEPMTEYDSIIKIGTASSVLKRTKIGETGMDLYRVMYKRIFDKVIIDVENPVCGTSTITSKTDTGSWDYATQTNRPYAHVPENAHYHLVGDGEIERPGAFWSAKSTVGEEIEPFIGTIEGGRDYYIQVVIQSDYGYMFQESGPEIITNGDVPIDSFGARGGAYAMVSLKAEHVIVNDTAVPATFKAAGKTEGSHCSACGEIITAQKAIAKLGVAKLSKVMKGRKKFTAKWKAVKNVDGYQIQYSLKKNMKKSKKKTVKGTKKTKATIKKLKTKKTYYVRIRAYKVINGKKVYSKWSAKKKVKVK